MTKEEISLMKWILKLSSIPYVSVYFTNDLFFSLKTYYFQKPIRAHEETF